MKRKKGKIETGKKKKSSDNKNRRTTTLSDKYNKSWQNFSRIVAEEAYPEISIQYVIHYIILHTVKKIPLLNLLNQSALNADTRTNERNIA